MAATSVPGIHAIAIPTPYAVGDVNVFLIDDDPLTLVDCGPNVPGALETLEAGLIEAGKELRDIELLVVTHEHLDHLGLVRTVAERSGAKVACLDALVDYAAEFDLAAQRDRAFARSLMRRHGVDASVSDRRVQAEVGLTAFRTDLAIPHAGTLELRDRTLHVIHAPGHSWTDTLFLDTQYGALIVGDHLLADISSNALVASRPYARDADDDAGVHRRALVEYLDALAQTATVDASIVLSGHGAPIDDHRDLIRLRFAEVEERASTILDLVRSKPSTAWEIARALWRTAARQPYLALSEVLGHLDLLAARALVARSDDESVVRFAAV